MRLPVDRSEMFKKQVNSAENNKSSREKICLRERVVIDTGEFSE